MSQQNRKWIFTIATLLVITILCSQPSYAGFSGHNAKGDYGLQSATQLAPGFYVNPYYYRYVGDSLKDKNGDSVQIGPGGQGSLDINAYVLGFHWVSEFKILGGNYGIQIYPAFTNNTLEVPILGLEDSVDTGFSDLYFQPVNLGWHTDRADFSIGFGVTAPTGEYEPGGSDNTGLGMWSFEFFAGTTIYFDKAKSWHLALMAFYETHTEKEDSDIKVGDILTLEGGLGKSFMDGALSVGAAYYAQWKITDDDLGNVGGGSLGKYQVYGVGPEITVPLASSKKLYGFLNARYLWEFDAESTLQGDTFVFTFLFPIPSWPLQ